MLTFQVSKSHCLLLLSTWFRHSSKSFSHFPTVLSLLIFKFYLIPFLKFNQFCKKHIIANLNTQIYKSSICDNTPNIPWKFKNTLPVSVISSKKSINTNPNYSFSIKILNIKTHQNFGIGKF